MEILNYQSARKQLLKGEYIDKYVNATSASPQCVWDGWRVVAEARFHFAFIIASH